MSQTTPNLPMLDLFKGVVDCFTPEVAQRIVDLRLDDKSQKRVDELADKCNEGLLSPQELAEYDYYVRTINFISILQNSSRHRLQKVQGRQSA